MTLSRRERLMLALLPPVLILAAHFGFLASASASRIQAADKRLAERGDGSSLEQTQRALKEAIAKGQLEIERLSKEKLELTARANALNARWSSPSARPSVVRAVTSLCTEKGARVVSSRAPEPKDASPAPSEAMAALARTMRERGLANPALWRIDLVSRWSDLVLVLNDLASVRGFVLPLSLQIEPRSDADELNVTLWLWI